MITKALLFSAGMLALGTATAGPAPDINFTSSEADAVRIYGFVGTVEIREGRTFRIEMMGAPEGGPIEVFEDDGAVVVKGDKESVAKLYRKGSPYRSNWRNNWDRDDAIEKFGEFLEDYPVLSVTIPAGSDLKIDTAALIVDADISLGEVDLMHLKEVYGSFGDSTSLNAGIGGTGELSFRNVENMADISIGGAGDIFVGNAGEANVRIGGAGDVELGRVKKKLDIRIGGSGDVSANNVGALEVAIGGSGDVEVDNVSGSLFAKIAGSGDIAAKMINGPLSIDVNGSGDVEIGGGKSSSTKIRINGSGDVRFDGTANDPDVSVYGAGDVVIKDYTGKVKVAGDKDDIRIGDLRFDDDR